MGKMAKAINDVIKDIPPLEKDIDDIVARKHAVKQNYKIQSDFCTSGCDVIVMYLTEKWKAKGEKFDDHLKDTIKDILDPNVGKSIKEVATAAANLAKSRKAVEDWEKERDDIRGRLSEMKTAIKDLTASVAKRKKKLLLSKKYKTKLKTYETLLDELATQVDDLIKSLATKILTKFSTADRYKFTATTTVEDIQEVASVTLTQDFATTPQEDAAEAAKFRGKPFSKQLAGLKDWATEADEMESESEE